MTLSIVEVSDLPSGLIERDGAPARVTTPVFEYDEIRLLGS